MTNVENNSSSSDVPSSNDVDRNLMFKLRSTGASQYFDRSYSLTEDEINEMAVIRLGLLTGNPDASMREMLTAVEEDKTMNDRTKNAIKTIFFPSPAGLKPIFLKSETIKLYDDDQCYEMMLFSNGFLIREKKTQTQKVQKRGNFFGRLGSLYDESKEDSKPQGRGLFGNKPSGVPSDDTNRRKIHSAFLFSDVDRIENLNVWKVKEVRKHLNGNDELKRTGRAFAIFIRDEVHPIFVICTTEESVTDWIESFRICMSGQKTKVFGKSRTTLTKDGVLFGINNRGGLRAADSMMESFSGAVQWDDDEEIDW